MNRNKIIKQNLSDLAFQNLKERILNLELKPGTRLVVETQMKEMGVGFTPVRDAFKMLVNEGLVTYNGNSYSVVQFSEKDVIDLFIIRASLEVLAVKLSIESGDSSLAGALGACCEEAEQAVGNRDYTRVTELDVDFHKLLTSNAGNPQLKAILDNLKIKGWLIRRWVFDGCHNAGSERETIEEHRQIVTAVLAGNCEQAEQAMKKHMEISSKRTAAALRTVVGG